MPPRVIKIGGAALSDGGWLEGFARAVAASDSPLIVVHGGGPEISALSDRLGVAVTWSGGRRVTSPEALDIASMVLNGRSNKRIVAALVDGGVDALGVSGEDGGLVTADIAEGGALGRVGVVTSVRAELLEWLLARGIVPVVSPISRGPDGQPLNVNADEVAAAVAVAVQATELLFVTDVDGVRAAGRVVGSLGALEASELIARNEAKDGMAVKLRAALDALERGVPAVRIGRSEVLTRPEQGTRLLPDLEVLAC
jgi:acetylglutamate kinase